jgi:uroporphyrinogen-III synthase
MPIDCLLITRPQPEANELADQLADLGLNTVIQPAHEFTSVPLGDAVLGAFQTASGAGPAPLVIFTSTRAVYFALQQIPADQLAACQLAAIGPATARALEQSGLGSVIQPDQGYTSEDLLRTLDESSVQALTGWIVAAEGGRDALLRGLRLRGITAGWLLVYERQAATILAETVRQLEQSTRILSVWTSADAMQKLARGLSARAWQQVCAGHWLVVSQRLADIAPDTAASVLVSKGPGNIDLAHSIRQLCMER